MLPSGGNLRYFVNFHELCLQPYNFIHFLSIMGFFDYGLCNPKCLWDCSKFGYVVRESSLSIPKARIEKLK